jgi:hypothetical protein
MIDLYLSIQALICALDEEITCIFLYQRPFSFCFQEKTTYVENLLSEYKY